MTHRIFLVVPVLASLAAGGSQAVKPDAARISAMHVNFSLVSQIQSAIVRGDLDAAREPARRLAAVPVPPGLPDAASRYAGAMARFARDAEAARQVTSAALATGQMLTTCGGCHRAVGTRPAIAEVARPPLGGTVGHMLEHQRAIDQLQRGLVIPSDAEWLSGARALRAAPLHARELPRDAKLTPDLLRVEEAVHRLAEDAVAAEMPESRARIYSTLLARCADCHGLHRRIWGPKE